MSGNNLDAIGATESAFSVHLRRGEKRNEMLITQITTENLRKLFKVIIISHFTAWP